MNYQEYIKLLKEHTSSQPYEHQLKLAILICQKLYFDYQKFYEVYEWGDVDLLMDAIIVCQKAIDDSIEINQVKALIPKIDEITPDTDDFGTEIGSYALNAAAAVYETLEFIIDKDKTHIYNIANYYTDTIDFKIQEERTLTEKEIENNDLMLEAWNFILEQTKNSF